MSFEHTQAFLLFFLVLLYLLIYLLPRRYTPVPFTYAEVWEKVHANKGKKSINIDIKRLLTILIALLILSSVILSLANPQLKPQAEKPTELFILIDNSPSTLRRTETQSPLFFELLDQAYQSFEWLQEDEQAWFITMKRGKPILLGPFSAHEKDQAYQALQEFRIDFYPQQPEDYVKALHNLLSSQKQSIFSENFADRSSKAHTHLQPKLLILSDDKPELAHLPWPQIFKGQVFLDLWGRHGYDAHFLSVEKVGGERARVLARGGKRMNARYLEGGDASALLAQDPDGGLLVELEMPRGKSGIRLHLDSEEDQIPENNEIILYGNPRSAFSIGIVSEDELSQLYLQDFVADLKVPKLEIKARARGGKINDPIILSHNVSNFEIGPDVQAVVSFGTLPQQLGKTAAAQTGGIFSGRLTIPAWLTGEESSLNVSNFYVDTFSPLAKEEKGWAPLLSDLEKGTLIAIKRFDTLDALYIASDVMKSELFSAPPLALFLKRWFEQLSLPQSERLSQLPGLIRGDTIELKGESPLEVRLESSILGFKESWQLYPQAGKLGFTETWIPGKYHFFQPEAFDQPEHKPMATKEVDWLVDEKEVAYSPMPSRRFQLPKRKIKKDPLPAWLENLSETLLFFAFWLLFLEWILYWLKITD